MSFKLGGLNSLPYLGVEPSTPPQLLYVKRRPTKNDFVNINAGTLWLFVQLPTIELYMAATVFPNNATWILIYPQASSGVIQTVFTTSGNWNVNPNTKYAQIFAIGGGSGGGSGSVGASGVASGGGGGAPGNGFYFTIFGPFVDTTPVPVVVGTGGAGGAAVNTNNTPGINGGQGTVTSVGSLMKTAVSSTPLFQSGGGGGAQPYLINFTGYQIIDMRNGGNTTYLGGFPALLPYVAAGVANLNTAASGAIVYNDLSNQMFTSGITISSSGFIPGATTSSTGIGTVVNIIDGTGNQLNDAGTVAYLTSPSMGLTGAAGAGQQITILNGVGGNKGTFTSGIGERIGGNLIAPLGGGGGSGVVPAPYRGGNAAGYTLLSGVIVTGTNTAGGAAATIGNGNNGATGNDYITNLIAIGQIGTTAWGSGGGGGSATVNAGVGLTAGNGGRGGFPGGGGGGGGAAVNSGGAANTSGAGGDGAGGIVIILEFL